MHKLRRTMVRPDRDQLSGVVEIDEVFIGNETRAKAGGVTDNTAAMVAVECLPGRKLGRVRMEVSPLAGSAALVEFAQRTIAPGSTIRTDGARPLRVLSDLAYQHEYFVGLASALPAHVFLPGVHMVASLLKRWLTGTRHPARRRLTGSPGLLPGRVHLPVQMAHSQGPRAAVLPTAPTVSRPERPHQAIRTRRLSSANMYGTWGESVGNPSELLVGLGFGGADPFVLGTGLPWGFQYRPDDLAAVGGG